MRISRRIAVSLTLVGVLAFTGEAAAKSFTWSSDGGRLCYLSDDRADLWLVEVAAALPARHLARAGALGGATSIDDCLFSPDGRWLLAEANGDLFRLDPADGAAQPLVATATQESHAAFSPDGRHLAFTSDANLEIVDLESGARRALTGDGVKDRLLYGQTDWVYWEEIWNRTSVGFWWSPDSRRIAYYRFDETPVTTYTLPGTVGITPPTREQPYPQPGGALPRVRLGILDILSGQTTWLDTGPSDDHYLAYPAWTADGGAIALQTLNRAQTELDLLICNPQTGACQSHLREEAATWVNFSTEFRFLPNGDFLWVSERSGHRELFHFDFYGKPLRRLTPDGYEFDSLEAVNGKDRWILFTAHPLSDLGAKDRQIYRFALDGASPELISPAVGWNQAIASGDGKHWVHLWSDADHPARITLRDSRGLELQPLPIEASDEDPASDDPKWQFLTLAASSGPPLPAALLQPKGASAAAPAPVIVYHYGCPEAQAVENRWVKSGRSRWHLEMARRGYGILVIDSRISTYFGKAGAERAHRRFGPDQLAALEAAVFYLEDLDWVDPERLGLWGWSGGGASTLQALLERPGLFRAGVAGAPVTDWRLYDAIWTERYLDRPEENPDGYLKSSPLTVADKLDDPLLLVHGLADDNVHPLNSWAIAERWVELGKQFEFGVYPTQKHAFTEPSMTHFFARMTEFFERHLATAP